jgi:uncharacterized protein YjbJ (UPF0337 family)
LSREQRALALVAEAIELVEQRDGIRVRMPSRWEHNRSPPVTTSLVLMGNGDGEPDERPATWENEVVGEAKELAGRAFRDEELAEEGEEQVEIAQQVREEYNEKQRSDKRHD